MNDSDIKIPDALNDFLDKLDKKAQEDGYPPDIIRNMRNSPEMMDILVRMIGAELAANKRGLNDKE